VVAAWADLLGGRLAEAAARFGGGRG
jgi:hypothetical protein